MKFQAKIDLHGYTLQDAYTMFEQFVFAAHDVNIKNILVITGKGPAELESPKTSINYELPAWCENPILRKIIKSVRHSDIQHGGKGAYYVTLKY